MRDSHDGNRKGLNEKGLGERVLGSLMLLSFGCLMLAYLVAIDHVDWFTLRPVSGTAAAMSNASHMPERATPNASRPIEKAGDVD